MAKWIWKRGENRAYTWMCFVKDFSCEAVLDTALVKIAADTKYWLFINGKTVLLEGGLKRGLTPASTYYDVLDIAGNIKKGTNRIALLVWFFGKDGFSHVSCGRGGIYLDSDWGLETDESWKAKRNEAYITLSEGEERPNFRLPESDVCFDASLDLGDWTDSEYDVSDWENAEEWNAVEAQAFGTLVMRPIPFFRFTELQDFINSDSVRGLKLEKDTVLEMCLPENIQFTPFLQLDAPPGKRIIIRPDHYYTNAPGEYCLKCVYITKAGLQSYESPGWLNGQKVMYEMPAGITIHALRYRKTEYAADPAGSFICDDSFLNRLWEKSYFTLHICMRDTFMDCPNRERAQWWGDANIQMQMLVYCMDQKANELYENGVNTMAEWYAATGKMLTVVPSGSTQFELPLQNLAGICGFYVYYTHSGNVSLIRKAYPMSRQYVLQYALDTNGFVIHRSGSWDWADWGENADIVIMENAWYCMALDACVKMANLLGLPEDAETFGARSARVRAALKTKINADGVFYNQTGNGQPDDRANALAVLAHCCDGLNQEKLANVIFHTENASPYMEKYVLDALCELGRTADAVARMKRRYQAMVQDDSSTLWELWNKDASLNHGWSGGPLITMSKYIAGVQVEDGDGTCYRIAPCLCGLRRIACTVPTRFGPLKVTIDKDHQSMEAICPEELSVTAEAPRGEEKDQWNIVLRRIKNQSPSGDI